MSCPSRPHVVSALLNHADFRRGISAVYDRARLESQIYNALLTWEAYVMEIVEGRVSGDRVVPLRA